MASPLPTIEETPVITNPPPIAPDGTTATSTTPPMSPPPSAVPILFTTSRNHPFHLRPWQPSDAPALALIANNPRIAANLRDRFPHPYTLSDAEAFIALHAPSATNPHPTIFAVRTASSSVLVGSIGFRPATDVHRLTAEVGYFLSEAYWGQGIMSAALAALTQYAWEYTDLVRLSAGAYEFNRGSARVMEKAGWELECFSEASAIKGGKVMGQWVYVSLRPGIVGRRRGRWVSEGEGEAEGGG